MIYNEKIYVLTFLLTFLLATTVYADEDKIVLNESNSTNTIKEVQLIGNVEELFDDVKFISESVEDYPDRTEYIKEYLDLKTGEPIFDTVIVKKNLLRTDNGNDTISRKLNGSEWTISLTASFEWTNPSVAELSKVRCTYMNATKTKSSHISIATFDETRDSDWVKVGKAKAQVDYHFYVTENPMDYNKGTFGIACTDDGRINDYE